MTMKIPFLIFGSGNGMLVFPGMNGNDQKLTRINGNGNGEFHSQIMGTGTTMKIPFGNGKIPFPNFGMGMQV